MIAGQPAIRAGAIDEYKSRNRKPEAKTGWCGGVRTIHCRAPGASLGAEIHGLDLKKGLDPETFRAFEAALIEHKIVVLRDQHLTTEQHVAVSRLFGELEVHPMRPQGEFPEILVLDNHKDNPVLSTDVWHSDTTFRKNPTKYTILRCQVMPQVGGDTLWANMEAAYEGLSDVFKAMIADLKAVHDFQNFRVLFKNTDEDRAKLRKMEEMFPNPLHPIVRTHPVTRRKSIYVNPQFTLRVEGLGRRRKPRHPASLVRSGPGPGVSVPAALDARRHRVLGQSVDPALCRQRLLSRAPPHGAHGRGRRHSVLRRRSPRTPEYPRRQQPINRRQYSQSRRHRA